MKMNEDRYPAEDQYGGVLVIVLLITIIVKHRLHVWFAFVPLIEWRRLNQSRYFQSFLTKYLQ